jgi:ABC-type phosphate/phosphonate transport system substrate-binding protein
MKKVIAIVAVAIALTSLVGCGGSSATSAPKTSPASGK